MTNFGFLFFYIFIDFYLILWNITYMSPVVMVQPLETMSNLLNFRCRPRSGVGKMWKRTVSTTHSCIVHSSAAPDPKRMNSLSNLLCLMHRKSISVKALETGNAVIDTMGTILPISLRCQQFWLIMATARQNSAIVNQTFVCIAPNRQYLFDYAHCVVEGGLQSPCQRKLLGSNHRQQI